MSYRIVVRMKAQVFYVLCVGVLCLLKSAAAAAATDAPASRRDYAAKLGVCPRRRLDVEVEVRPAVCAESCAKDRDCPGKEKCCSNGCGRQCTPPRIDIVKPGVCPRRRLEVEVGLKPAVCAELCDNDSDCPGKEKCCSRPNGCGRQCTPPQKDIVKPGVCPRRRLEVEVGVKPGVCAELCDNDSDCPGKEKCCSNGCGRQCTPPQKDIVKPGVCPRRRLEVEVGLKPAMCAELCDNDSDCPGKEKCCSRPNGCGRQCTPPQKDIVKPGVCPRRRLEVEVGVKPGVCAELCDNDSDCPGKEKCCSNGCGRQCTPPQKDIVKPGVCPRRRLEVEVGLKPAMCAELCDNDSDCPGKEKCCSRPNGCGRQCTPPQKDIVKPGVCPRRRLEFEVGVKPAVCAELCDNDSDCQGKEKCCSNGCGRQCTPPQKDIVKPGVCPRRRLEVEVGLKPAMCAELCDNDSDCPGKEKCCSRPNGCGRQCTPPQKDIVKPGVCPLRRLEVEVGVKPAVCAELCDNDSDCPEDEKCCSRPNGCGRQCTPPQKDKVKPGVCPRRKFEEDVRPPICAELCANDGDCPGNKKCCSTGCGHQCRQPYKV